MGPKTMQLAVEAVSESNATFLPQGSSEVCAEKAVFTPMTGRNPENAQLRRVESSGVPNSDSSAPILKKRVSKEARAPGKKAGAGSKQVSRPKTKSTKTTKKSKQ